MTGVEVDLATGTVRITADPPPDRAALSAAVDEAGYELAGLSRAAAAATAARPAAEAGLQRQAGIAPGHDAAGQAGRVVAGRVRKAASRRE